MTVLFAHEPRRACLHATLMPLVFGDLTDTAAQEMAGEMPIPSGLSDNWAAGPTESEVWWREVEDELERRAAD